MDLALWASGCTGLCPRGSAPSSVRALGEPGSCRSCSREGCFWWIYKFNSASNHRIQKQPRHHSQTFLFCFYLGEDKHNKSSKWGFQYSLVSTGTWSDLPASHHGEDRPGGKEKVGENRLRQLEILGELFSFIFSGHRGAWFKSQLKSTQENVTFIRLKTQILLQNWKLF